MEGRERGCFCSLPARVPCVPPNTLPSEPAAIATAVLPGLPGVLAGRAEKELMMLSAPLLCLHCASGLRVSMRPVAYAVPSV